MTGSAAAFLQGRAVDGIACRLGDIERRTELLGLFRRQPFVVDAVEPVGIDMPLEALLVVRVVRQHHHAARRIHDVIVEILAQAFPQFEGMLVDVHALFIEIVGPNDGGIAAGIAAAEPALLDHRHIRDAVFLGKIIGSTEPMAATADDDDIIGRTRFGRGPLRLPSLMAAHGLAGQRKNRILAHSAKCSLEPKPVGGAIQIANRRASQWLLCDALAPCYRHARFRDRESNGRPRPGGIFSRGNGISASPINRIIQRPQDRLEPLQTKEFGHLPHFSMRASGARWTSQKPSVMCLPQLPDETPGFPLLFRTGLDRAGTVNSKTKGTGFTCRYLSATITSIRLSAL